ncbi:hypothetical protein RUM43_012548 [Polyplax serrata]|uniref:Uncharacterized protein n=1 Tax=Polyplax serrata TaxID=468196 RepID=A0AAN8RT23_POLSC
MQPEEATAPGSVQYNNNINTKSIVATANNHTDSLNTGVEEQKREKNEMPGQTSTDKRSRTSFPCVREEETCDGRDEIRDIVHG